MTDFGECISAAYQSSGGSVMLGRGMIDGTTDRTAVVQLSAAMCNRHGLIAGATGTGKTVTLQLLAEQLSAMGVSVFAADMKGDLSGISEIGAHGDRIDARVSELGITWAPAARAVQFLSLGGVGVPVRATVSDFGPTLLAKVMDANETQTSSLTLVFRYADDQGLGLLDLADLRAVLQFLLSDDGKADLKGLGGLSSATAGGPAAQDRRTRRAGRRGTVRRASARSLRPHRNQRRRIRHRELSRTPRGAGQAPAVLDLLALVDRRAVRNAPRGRRPRPTEAGVLLRRGAPALRRGEQGVPRADRPNGSADSVQGSRHLLRHPAARRCARRGVGPARQPRATRTASVHPPGCQGVEGGGKHVSPDRGLRPGIGAHPARHR